MPDDENKNERDKKYEEAKQTESNSVKIDFMLDRLRTIEDRLDDNGISEKVYRNSWAVGIFGTIMTGLIIAILTGAI